MSSKNQKDKKDKDDKELLIFFSQSAKLFEFCGLWDDATRLSTVKHNVVGFLIMQCCAVCWGVMALSGIFDLRSQGNYAKSIVVSITAYVCLVALVKNFAIWNSVGGLKQCFRSLQDIASKFENQLYILKALKLYRILFTLGHVLLNMTVFLLAIIPVLEGTRTFPYDTKNPVEIVDLLQSPFYEIIYAWQVIVSFVLCNVIISCDTLFCGVMAMVAAIMESINNIFEETFISKTTPDLSEEAKLKIFCRVIEDFIEISRIIDIIKGVFNLISLTEVMLVVSIIGTALYFISVMKFQNILSIMMTVNMILQVLQLGFYCYFGEIVVQQTRKLRYNIYESDWYNQSKSLKVMTLLTLQRLQNEPRIAAGKVIPLSLATFAEVIKNSYALYAFLHNVRKI